MLLRTMLTLSAIYLGILGVGFMLAPQQIGIGAVPPDPPPALVAYLRIFGGPCVGIAVLDAGFVMVARASNRESAVPLRRS